MAIVTIHGPAEEILSDVQRLRGGKRTVRLTVGLTDLEHSKMMYPHFIPEIKGGQTQEAHEILDKLVRQRRIDQGTEERLDSLIEEFGRFTD